MFLPLGFFTGKFSVFLWWDWTLPFQTCQSSTLLANRVRTLPCPNGLDSKAPTSLFLRSSKPSTMFLHVRSSKSSSTDFYVLIFESIAQENRNFEKLLMKTESWNVPLHFHNLLISGHLKMSRICRRAQQHDAIIVWTLWTPPTSAFALLRERSCPVFKMLLWRESGRPASARGGGFPTP